MMLISLCNSVAADLCHWFFACAKVGCLMTQFTFLIDYYLHVMVNHSHYLKNCCLSKMCVIFVPNFIKIRSLSHSKHYAVLDSAILLIKSGGDFIGSLEFEVNLR